MKLPSLEDIRQRLGLFGGGGRVGCDFGSFQLKIVRLRDDAGHIRLSGHGLLPTQWDEESGEGAEAIVAPYFDGRELPRKLIAAHLPQRNMLTRTMNLADGSSDDVAMAVRWEFRNAIEGDVERLQVEFIPVGGAVDGNQKVIAHGVLHDAIEERVSFCEAAGLTVGWLEPLTSALMSAMSHSLYWQEGEYLALLEIGYSETVIIIGGEREMQGCSVIPLSLDVLAERLFPEAEEGERPQMIHALLTDEAGNGGGENAEEILTFFYTELLVYVQQALDAFAVERSLDFHEGVQRLFLSGGGALLPGIEDMMIRSLGIGVDRFNPFRQITNEIDQAVSVPFAPLYTVAVGLALPPTG